MNPEIVSFQYATGVCLFLENVGGSEQNQSVANVQSDDLCPSRMHAATHICSTADRVPTPPWKVLKSTGFFSQISRPWKVLENDFGP